MSQGPGIPEHWIFLRGETAFSAFFEDAPRNLIVAALAAKLDAAIKARFGRLCFVTQDYMIDTSKTPAECTPAAALWEESELGHENESGVPIDRCFLEIWLYIWVKNKSTGTEVQRTLNRVTSHLKKTLWNISTLDKYRVEVLRRGSALLTHGEKAQGAVTMIFTLQYDLPIAV